MNSIILYAVILVTFHMNAVLAEPKPIDGLVGQVLNQLLGSGDGPLPAVIPIILPGAGAPALPAGGHVPAGLPLGPLAGGAATLGLPAGHHPGLGGGAGLADATALGALSSATATNTGDKNDLTGIGNSVNNLIDLDLA
ncbi:elastin-like [Eupeodes corollae]|uniref:elastin-like n=1 Tax=Eupeodes corollae TaxID=290404 RepID=UPI0024936BEF|nr:elastin-like [Eupeodes corollae]